MKKIIAATDFSPVSLNAVHFAADMALAVDAELILFHAYNIPVAFAEVPVSLVSVQELEHTSVARLKHLQDSLQHIYPGKLTVQTKAILGNTVDELEILCKNIQPFAVVMGAHGKTGLENIIFGSTTLTAIRHITWPIICVPPGKTYGDGIKKIGFACDFQNVANTTPVRFIKQLVKEFSADLYILNVDHNNKHFHTNTPEQSFLLHTLLEDLHPTYHYIDNPDIENGIHEFAENNNLDLVIAIPKKHKLLEGIFHPSSTKQLIFQSHVPVLCVHE